MNKMTIILITAWSLLISSNAHAVLVPEIDGANSMLGLGLVAGIVALMREHRRRK
jgi:hypothetical protein